MKDQEKNNKTNKKYTDYTKALAEENILSESDMQYVCNHQEKYTLQDYYALPDTQRVELIDGMFYDMAAPGLAHRTAAAQIFRQLDAFIDMQDGSCLPFMSPVDVQLDCDDRTMVQPDVVVLCDMRKARERCIYGAPDLVIEVLSPSTAWKDQVIKRKKYQHAGVREYWMIDLKQEKVIVYDFEHEYHPVIYGMDVPVPVRIYEGKCQIQFDGFYARMKSLLASDASSAAIRVKESQAATYLSAVSVKP
ncbi:MAG: Uma2 family endonuclease [Lachnospiraceae bacterium]|nr:Uma2 family endonuclease [Lachnospiraceae bacterium]